MRRQQLFHVSFYATLALASACLALPATFFLWWMPFFFVAVLGLLVAAWRQEGRWQLSDAAANQIGVVLALGAAGWLVFHIPRSEDDLIGGRLGWPAGLLPYLGPFLQILLIVKLFRAKRLADFWGIQSMGLVLVGLAAVLADEQLFGLLLLLYWTSLLWTLVQYYPLRQRYPEGAGAGAAGAWLFEPNAAPLPPGRWWELPRTLRWTAVVGAAAFVLYLATPRLGQAQWNALQLSTRLRLSSRGSDAAGMDLNRTGRVELSEEPAFAVAIRDSQGRTVDPARVPRWRVDTLELYSGGRWYPFWRTPVAVLKRALMPRLLPLQPLPDRLKADEWLVTIDVKPSVVGGLVLAEPVDVELGIGLGPASDGRPLPQNLWYHFDGCDVLGVNPRVEWKRAYSYAQLVRSGGAAASRTVQLYEEFTNWLAEQPVPEVVRSWTTELVGRLPDLSAAARRLDDRGRVVAGHEAEVAEALCRYLTASGEYRYSLDLRRDDASLDPTADFLINVKEGHCERFAGGLALMLRAVGIRSRVVKGYLAADSDDAGQSIVRRSQAHSWVEALIPGEAPGQWRWLELDPTPSAVVTESMLTSWWRWLSDSLDLAAFWRHYIVDYEAERQADFWTELAQALLGRRGVVILAAAALVGAVLWRGRRWVRRLTIGLGHPWRPWRQSSAAALFATLVHLLEQHGGPSRRAAETPREYAEAAAALLARQGPTRSLSGLPLRLAAAYYRARFGGRPPTAAEAAELAAALAGLRERLAGVHLVSSR
ncbi:MAG: DUF3488 and transglutaminase-like domain-containing protein [Gemmataceae bacterium]|nr:DUF3488 and transglutaminase-like domain-containing protein [Gemmataceae bacterium]